MNKISTLNTAFKISRAFDIMSSVATFGAVATTVYVAYSFLKTK